MEMTQLSIELAKPASEPNAPTTRPTPCAEYASLLLHREVTVGLEGILLWMRLFVLQKKMLQFFQTKDYKIQKILEDLNFIRHLSYLSDILGVMDHCICYL